MTTPEALTPEEERHERDDHGPTVSSPEGTFCGGCDYRWPCPSARLLATLDAERAARQTPDTSGLRGRIERDARFQDALDALDLAALWLHRTADLPHMPSHQADSWERKARSGRVALRAALAATATERPLDVERLAEAISVLVRSA